MTTYKKLDWTRKNWKNLRAKGKLNGVIQKILDKDEWLRTNYSVQDIIDIEESLPSYLT